MIKFVVGFVLGFAVATIGIGGLTSMADRHLTNAREMLQKQSTEVPVKR